MCSPCSTRSPSRWWRRSSRISMPKKDFAPASKQPDSIDAWGLVVRALSLTSKIDRPQNEEARNLLRRAIGMDRSLCARPCAAELGAVVGGLLLLAARPARRLSRVGGRSGVRGLARCQRPVGAHDLRALAQPGGAARARAGRAARRACAQPELRARAHGVRLGALPCRRIRRGRQRDRARAAHEPGRQLLRASTPRSMGWRCSRRSVSRKRCRICARRSRRSPTSPATTTR